MNETINTPPLERLANLGGPININLDTLNDGGWKWEYPLPKPYNQGSQPYTQPYNPYPLQPPPITDINKLHEEVKELVGKVYDLEQFRHMQEAHNYRTTQFEKVMGEMFSYEEKHNYLLTIGYSLNESGYYIKVDEVNRQVQQEWRSLDELFNKEMMIKFKNLLLAKQPLKLNLLVNDKV